MRKIMIVAFIRNEVVEHLLEELKNCGVPGASFVPVKGYGEYVNYYSRDGVSAHTRIEIITDEEQENSVLSTIENICRSGTKGDGIVAVLPVLRSHRIRNSTQAG